MFCRCMDSRKYQLLYLDAIPRCPLMYFIDDDKLDIRLYTDASDFGIGGVLIQVVDTIWQPIALSVYQ